MSNSTTLVPALRRHRLGVSVLTAGLLLGGLTTSAGAVVEPGTPAKDVTIGLDNDNADNPFIQPPGVSAPQSMDNADVLFGRDNDDLLIGNLGSDTLLGGNDDDILVGGPDHGQQPSSDVLVGDDGDDIAIWSPGDGNDAFAGNEDNDTMIFAPLVTNPDGSVLLTRDHGRRIPHVDIGGQPGTCTVVPVPDSENLGAQFLVRFNVDDVPVATVRQKDVEKVYCPSPTPGTARVATLDGTHPEQFRTIPLDHVRGVVGHILAPMG